MPLTRAVVVHIGIASALLVPGLGLAGEPPTEPHLRIETGMHTEMIHRIGVDAAEQYVVTGADDKTVRVWDLDTGRLVQVLRPPRDEGNEGKIYAVAISPNGRTIAAAGWTGGTWDGSFSIYLFDRVTGTMRPPLLRVPVSIHHLAYSPDGRFLVATLWGEHGIRVYRTQDYQPVPVQDDPEGYGDAIHGADFDGRAGGPTSRLVTTSLDRFLRLYALSADGRAFTFVRKRQTEGNGRPLAIHFSPDGTKVAVGFYDSPTVEVRSGESLVLQVLEAMRESGRSLAELTKELVMFPQVLLNVAIPRGFDWKKHESIKKAQAEAEQSLNGKGRVLLRPSGTEPVLRVMVEGEPKNVIESAADSIAAAVRRATA